MITLQDPEYRRLARESSNFMMHHDGEWLQGNYEEAGQWIWKAGLLRLQMAALSREAHDPCRAMCDALSAAACFIKANNLKWAERALARIPEEGPIPPERLDIVDALAERHKQFRKLANRLKRFSRTLAQHPEWLAAPDESALKLLEEQIEEFPGWPRLYALLAYLENALRDFDASARHANLAAEFDPEDPLLVCLALVVRARVEPRDAVLAWGEQQRARFPEDAAIPLGLTYLHAFGAHDSADYRAALSALEPVACSPSLRVEQGAVALALRAFLARELGDAERHGQALRDLGQLLSRLDKRRRVSPVVAVLQGLSEALAGASRPADGHANGIREDARKSLRELEKALLLTCAAA